MGKTHKYVEPDDGLSIPAFLRRKPGEKRKYKPFPPAYTKSQADTGGICKKLSSSDVVAKQAEYRQAHIDNAKQKARDKIAKVKEKRAAVIWSVKLNTWVPDIRKLTREGK